MPSLSKASLEHLSSCHPDIQLVIMEAIKFVDFKVLDGHRNEGEQNWAFDNKRSTKRWPFSKHNAIPSLAVDIAPWPIDWNNVERFRYLSAFILGIAAAKGIKMRAGVDWNMNFNPKDEKFIDGPHLELA